MSKFIETLIFKMIDPNLRVEALVNLAATDRSQSNRLFSLAWEIAEKRGFERSWILDEAKKLGLKGFAIGKRVPKPPKKIQYSHDDKTEYISLGSETLKTLGKKNVVTMLKALGKKPKMFHLSLHNGYRWVRKLKRSQQTEVFRTLKPWPDERVCLLEDFVEVAARSGRWKESLCYIEFLNEWDCELWSLVHTLMDFPPKRLVDRRFIESFVKRRYGVKG